jgi:D-alanyl-D-alanine carboxypeptidase
LKKALSMRRQFLALGILVLSAGLFLAAPSTVVPVLAAEPIPPTCSYQDLPALNPTYDNWQLLSVDTIYMLPKDYAPPDLVSTGLAGGGQVRSLVKADLSAMAAAAATTGAPLAVASAYRSYTTQISTFAYWVNLSGEKAALLSSARPGHSEHQLGTALDFTSANGSAPWDYADWATTAAGKWMAAHAWEYGFINSYPRVGSPSLTCYQYEPWHYRYFGRTQAALIHTSGLTSRQWLWANGGANLVVADSPSPTVVPSIAPATPSLTPNPEISASPIAASFVASSPSGSPSVSPATLGVVEESGLFSGDWPAYWLIILIFIGLLIGITILLVVGRLHFFS